MYAIIAKNRDPEREKKVPLVEGRRKTPGEKGEMRKHILFLSLSFPETLNPEALKP
jgi:hypothetical protein